MANDINPNARTPFVSQNGTLSKYGQDVILKLYRALNFVGNEPNIQVDTSEIDNDIARLNSAFFALAVRVENIEDEPDISAARINQLDTRISENQKDNQDMHILLSRISRLEGKVNDLEAQL